MRSARILSSAAVLLFAALIIVLPVTVSFAYSYPQQYQLYWCNGYYSYSPCYSYYQPQYYPPTYYYPTYYYYPYQYYDYGYYGGYNYNYNFNYNNNGGWW